MPKQIIKLNLGCGTTKLPGFVNVDAEKSCKPDLVCDFTKQRLPYKANSVDEVVLFHTIEHISKKLHQGILASIWNILKPDGTFYLSYPEFTKCVENWKKNWKGQKEFWEATLYGRQLYPTDTHVCIMHTPDFKEVLESCGFKDIISVPEPAEPFNTLVSCRKGQKVPNYEDLIASMMNNAKIKKP